MLDHNIQLFQETVWGYYRAHGRDMSWRQPEQDGHFDPYKIMVSEIMLQQTQVGRVAPKYVSFLECFPTVQALAAAPLAEVLREWSGLGYNRRAKFLHLAAQQIVGEHNGHFPADASALTELKGVGPNTAAAIVTYAYNQAVSFIETNIRTVYIYHFFPDAHGEVSDKMLRPYIVQSLDLEHPREWHWALMDYGAHLKATVGNLSKQSAHYVKQGAFHGSKRKIRGEVIRLLLAGPLQYDALKDRVQDGRLDEVLRDLQSENFVVFAAGSYQLTS